MCLKYIEIISEIILIHRSGIEIFCQSRDTASHSSLFDDGLRPFRQVLFDSFYRLGVFVVCRSSFRIFYGRPHLVFVVRFFLCLLKCLDEILVVFYARPDFLVRDEFDVGSELRIEVLYFG